MVDSVVLTCDIYRMVDYASESLTQSLYALSDPTRRAILARIVQGETTVSELAEPFAMSLAAVSKHLQILERANFLTKVKSGRTITCRATLDPLSEVMELMEELGRYWNLQLDSLEKYLTDSQNSKEEKHGNKKRTPKACNSTGLKRKKRKSL